MEAGKEMRIPVICCMLGIIFLLGIAGLHGSGFQTFNAQMADSDASAFLKDVFPILYFMPSLYLLVLSVFGFVAIGIPSARRPICLVLAVSVAAAGALALLVGEWIPLAVMGAGAMLFAIAGLLSGTDDPAT